MISIYDLEVVKSHFRYETGSFHNHIHRKGLAIHYVIRVREEGSFQFITILYRGVFQSLLQNCKFVRKMERLR